MIVKPDLEDSDMSRGRPMNSICWGWSSKDDGSRDVVEVMEAGHSYLRER